MFPVGTNTQTGRILVAIDGEPHTDAAVKWALDLARDRDLEAVAIHVKDPYLKQFSNEIYAQGREEYLDHVEVCLDAKAKEAIDEFGKAADMAGIKWNARTVCGNPKKAIEKEVSLNDYRALVTGRKLRKGLAALRSPALPSLLLSASLELPILVVPSCGEKSCAME